MTSIRKGLDRKWRGSIFLSNLFRFINFLIAFATKQKVVEEEVETI